jgi:molecular chaperone HtpG
MLSNLSEYSGKKLQSVSKGDLELGKLEDQEVKEEVKKAQTTFEDTLKEIKKVLGDKIKEVRITHRLTDSPACLVADENEMSIHLQRIMQASGHPFPQGKPVFEINPEHPIILRLKDDPDMERFGEWVNILFDQAFLAEGGQLEDPATFVKRLNKLLLQVVV